VTFYVDVTDLKGTLDKAEKLGAKTVLPPTKTGPVEIAMFADPEGNVIGLAKGM
jgi:predicted enzyme related to lactoylglutathione lyase